MNVLVFGGHGMAGHVIVNYLRTRREHQVWYTARRHDGDALCQAVDVTDPEQVVTAVRRAQPDVVINAVGVLNQHAERNVEQAIAVNALFPLHLAKLVDGHRFRVIHISTDCVFSGKNGPYRESDATDGESVYAKTKSLGEIRDKAHVTTVRTSIIGPELKPDGIGLFHWAMQQTGMINGYQNVVWNGVTTLELAKAIDWLLTRTCSGLVHLACPDPISKYALLQLIYDIYEKTDVTIRPTLEPVSNKTLVNTRSDFTFAVPTYYEMLDELKHWTDINKSPREEYQHG